jgi:EAL domain-containing protein (putative c-di-GMP-specific phosphodiesterase class I)/ActR/RegA family two-component response regulator
VPSKRLLIVDDDVDVANLMARVARAATFETLTAYDAVDIENKVAQFNPDVLVLDLQMPGMDGVQLLNHLVEHAIRLPNMLVSGMGTRTLDTTAQVCKRLGLPLLGRLAKPFEIDAFQRLIEREPDPEPEVEDTPHINPQILATAINSGEIRPWYQPQVYVADGTLAGIEVLAHWISDDGAHIAPEVFVQMAEQSDLISPLTDRILLTAIEEIGDLCQLRGLPLDCRLSVNLSPDLLGDATLPDRVQAMVDNARFDPACLALEVTETGAMLRAEITLDVLTRLHLKGIELSMDDFGTGYTIVKHLYRLPYSEVKIDRSFVTEMNHSTEAQAIVRSIIQMAHGLGLHVVAEGVETLENMTSLRSMGCEIAQGFYIARPMPADALLTWLNSRSDPAAQVYGSTALANT